MPTGARWKCSSTTYPYRQKMALTERCQSASSYISTFPLFINKGWMKMLRGKRAVITGGGTGFGQALSVWLAREGVEVDFCARRADDIQKTCSIITAEGGMAKGHLCDLTLPESLSQFSSQLLTLDKPIDILILNAAQWLSGTLDDQSDTEIINTISSGLTGSILLTQALLPGLRRSESADIVSIISSCGIPNFTDSIAHPAFLPVNTGLAGLQLNFRTSCLKKIYV